MMFRLLAFVLSWFVGPLAALAAGQSSLPQVYGIPSRNLVEIKAMIAANDPWVATSYTKFLVLADKTLLVTPLSVMDKEKLAASGDKHDYFSFAPYWWPDASKPNGVPYIKYDGWVYPKSMRGTDASAFFNTCDNVQILAYAYYYSGREAYAAKAAELIRVWFLNPATRMNPSANYSQAVPGVINGRFEGVIEMRRLLNVTDAVALIAPSQAWTKDDQIGFKHWLETYYDWLLHTKLPVDKTSTENNHESWRTAQIVQFSLVLGKTGYAKKFLQEEFPRLLDMQVKADGSQPHELARTNSLGYSLFNLEALFRLATLGDAVGWDCWKYTTKDHSDLYSALDYLAPYTDPATPWPVQEVTPTDRKRIFPLLAEAYAQSRNEKYFDTLTTFAADIPGPWRLYWPCGRQNSVRQAELSLK